MSDHYSTLGVDRNSSPDDIKKAYRKMAAQHHPDRGGDTAKFQEIQSAYDTLSDPGRRQQYDNPQPQGFPGGGFHFHQGGGFPPGFEDIFSAFGQGHPFGDMFGQRQPQRNRTINLQTSITLEDAFYGKDLIANLQLPSGKNQTLEIKIPAGINDGTTLRLNQMGDDSVPNAPKGDIHLTVHVQPHSVFQRQGDDLIKQVDVSCIDAMLGKTIKITTIDNKILDITVPEGTQHGQTLAAAGYGMPKVNDNRFKGRLLILINITVPKSLTAAQKNILKQLQV
jgi:DnaJ-class molecular chaperone